jgi:uncharacterized membrane protein
MREERGGRVGLGFGLLAVSLTLIVGLGAKAPCASGDWGDGRQYRVLCYTDVVALYSARDLDDDRFPYFEAPNEYPVGTGLFMALGAALSESHAGFFSVNAVLLSGLAMATAAGLFLMVGSRALLFAAAPTLAIYAFVNWDLLAVALATFGTLAFLDRRDVAAGLLLGLGAAAKLYPGLLVVPFAAERLRHGETDRAIHLAWAASAAWIGLNLPFAVGAFGTWKEFFELNAGRGADWDSLWFSGCHRLFADPFWSSRPGCGHLGPINLLSLVLFVGAVALVWWRRGRRVPDFPRWTLGFPLVALFLLTNKVYSPQYSLWLLPWFALALPRFRLWLAFEAADASVFITRFAWFGREAADRDPSFPSGWTDAFAIGFFEFAVVVRAAIMVACVVAWVRAVPEEAPMEEASSEETSRERLTAAEPPGGRPAVPP